MLKKRSCVGEHNGAKGFGSIAGMRANRIPNIPRPPCSVSPENDELLEEAEHTITGCLLVDFSSVCREQGMTYVPDVMPRPRAPGKIPKQPRAVVSAKATESESPVKKTKGSGGKKLLSRRESDKLPRHVSCTTVSTPHLPKTKFEFFKPSVQVELDNPEDDKTVTEVYIRGWKVDAAMMIVLKRCLPALSHLRLLHMWNTALSEDTVSLMASFLPLCRNLTTLQLDGNSLAGAPVDLLVGESSAPLRQLSLRFCAIGDTELERLSDRLGWMHAEKQNLVRLDLSGNQIGDKGVEFLAESLKTNQTLGAINLTSNQVGDQGAASLAAAFTWFPIKGKLFLTRSKLLHDQLHTDPLCSTSKSGTDVSNNAKSKNTAPVIRNVSSKVTASASSSNRKQNKLQWTLPRDVFMSYFSLTHGNIHQTEAPLVLFSKTPLFARTVPPDRFLDGAVPVECQGSHSLLRGGYIHRGFIWLAGNRTLHSLNLTRNRVGETGVKALLTALDEQSLVLPQEQAGLQRLELGNNPCSPHSPHLQSLMRLMHLRSPSFKSPKINLDKHYVLPCALPVSVLV